MWKDSADSRPKDTPMTNVKRCSYDKLEIVSSAWPGWLWKNLPIKELRLVSHNFNIVDVEKNPFYHSRIILVCVPGSRSPIELLKASENSSFRVCGDRSGNCRRRTGRVG